MYKIKKETTKETCAVYRCQIIEMVGKIENPGILEYLHTFIKLFLEKWG